MKPILELLLGFAISVQAFAQGKTRFNNDSLHLVYWTTDSNQLYLADRGLAGQAYDVLQGSVPLGVELWAGTSSASFALVALSDFNLQTTPGYFADRHVIMPLPGGTGALFQIRLAAS
jgi:hypothetical protein